MAAELLSAHRCHIQMFSVRGVLFVLNNTVQEQPGPAKPTAFPLDSADTREPGRSIVEWISPGNPGEHLVLSDTKSGVSLGSWHGVLAIPQAGLWPAKVS